MRIFTLPFTIALLFPCLSMLAVASETGDTPDEPVVADAAADQDENGAAAPTEMEGELPPVQVTFDDYETGPMTWQDGWEESNAENYDAFEIVKNPVGEGLCLKALPDIRYRGIFREFTTDETNGFIDTFASRLRYRFDYYAGKGVAGYHVQRVAIGGVYGTGASFQPRDANANVWRYRDGEKEHFAKRADGRDWHFDEDGWVTIHGVIDYAQRKYTLLLDGVPQKGESDDGWLEFIDQEDTLERGPYFTIYVDGIQAPVFIDNIGLQLEE